MRFAIAHARAAAARFSALPGNVRGPLFLLVSGLVFAGMNVTIKLLGDRLGTGEIAFFRALIGLMFYWPFIAFDLSALRTQYPGTHAVRGFIGGFSMLLSFHALILLPMADATAYGFTRSLFLIVLAVLILREPVRVRRLAATIIGFIGVLIMLQPQGGLQFAALIALSSAFINAWVVVLVKRLMAVEKPVTVLFYFGLSTTLLTAVPAMLDWQAPTAREWVLLVIMGFLGGAAQSLVIRAYRAAEATVLAPFDYVPLLYATLLGYLFFADLPTVWTVVGAAIIVAANLYITYREHQLRLPPPPPEAPR